MRPQNTEARWPGWIAGGAALLAVISCYGLVAVTGALAFIGITPPVHDGAWAGAVSFFALLALAGLLLNFRRRRSLGPMLLALAGAGLVVAVMLVHYHWMAELVGFAALAGAAAWDWRLKRPLGRWEEPHARHHA